MAQVNTPTIDTEQIDGAFALAVDVQFTDLDAGTGQKVFDLADSANQNNIWFGQIAGTNDVEFVVVRDGVEFRVVAKDAIVEGEYATWRVGVDPKGEMRIAKNQDLLVEGPGTVPADVDRTYLIGKSSNPSDTDLAGQILNLKIANYGNVDELDPMYQDSPCSTTGELRCFCDKLLPEGYVEAGLNGATKISATDAEGDGEWSQVQSLGLIPIHAMVLPDGKVLSFGTNEAGKQTGQFVYSLYDPVTGVDKILPNTTGVDIFCSNMSIDPITGNVIILGGDARGEGGPVNGAVNDVVIFDYKTQTIRNAETGDMQYDRWYGSSVTLPNGEIFIIGGTGGGEDIPEIYNHETGMRTLTGAFSNIDAIYPKTFVRSDGQVIVFSANRAIYAIDTEGNGSSTKIGMANISLGSNHPSIMYDVDKVAMVAGNGELYTLDLAAATPKFTKVADVSTDRENGGMTILADGRVMIAGGGSTFNQLATADYSVEIWDPRTNQVETVENVELARLYHSSYLLMPNGMIWVGGGGAPGPLTNTNVEIYAPNYLYDDNGNLADRTDIVDAPSNVDNDETFRITVDDALDVGRVTAVRSGAFTHATNNDARFMELSFRVIDSTTIEITSGNANTMVPGAWMLYVIDDDGVPSVASMLGVSMDTLVETPPIELADTGLEVYGIDDDQIDGAFEVVVEARFDDVSGGNYQRVFDFGNGPASDNILLSQVAKTNDMIFQVFVGSKSYAITAKDVIEEGVVAKWNVGIDDTGYMRMWKDDILVAEGQGAVPKDIDRTSNLVGKSNWTADDDLKGMVRFLETVNDGDLPEYVHLALPRISLQAPAAVVEGDAGETTTLRFEVKLDQPAPSIISADITIEGNATGPAKLLIPAGEREATIEVTFEGDDIIETSETVTLKLTNVTQARVADALEATAVIRDDDAPGNVLTASFYNAPANVNTLDDVNFSVNPIHSESVTQVNHNAGSGAFYDGGKTDYFAAKYEGYFNSETAGDFTFYLTSDDGSALYIDGNKVIDNDGTHSATQKTAQVNLAAGQHSIEIRYFEKTGAATLDLDWSGPGFAREQMQFDAFLGNSRYELGTAGLSWEDAKAEAIAKGGKLVEVNSKAENDFIQETFGSNDKTIWLGFSDAATEGKFVDSRGADLSYSNWNTGEPNNLGNEDYASMYGSNGRWNDTNGNAGPNTVTVIEYETLPNPKLSITAPADVTEGDAGQTGEMIFTVSLDTPTNKDVVADVAISGGASGPAKITIPAGSTSASLVLTFAGDSIDEADETISVTLSNLVNADAGTSLSASAKILDDDEPSTDPSLTINDIVNEPQYLTGTGENDTFVIAGQSADYQVGPTEDGTGIIIWGPTGFDLLFGFDVIRFADKEVRADENGQFDIHGSTGDNGETVYNDTDGPQWLTGTTEKDVFVIDGNTADYGAGPTEDGKGVVVWSGDKFDILYGFDVLRFNDKDVVADENGQFNINGDPGTVVETLYDNVAGPQWLLGNSDNDVFVVGDDKDGYTVEKTQDGQDIVVWKGDDFDILYDFETVRFNDEDVSIADIA